MWEYVAHGKRNSWETKVERCTCPEPDCSYSNTLAELSGENMGGIHESGDIHKKSCRRSSQ